jgi:putative metallohydrolase (TIGR04338 family)
MRDSQRQRVYDAEVQVCRQLELAAAGARTVEVGSSTLVLPLEVRFGSLQAVQRYVDATRAADGFARHFPRAAAAPLRVRHRRGDRSAHYEAPGTIALHEPPLGTGWSLRELVVLHELAHHAAFHDLAPVLTHGPAYTGALVRIVTDTLGPETGLLLTTSFAEHGVAVQPVGAQGARR